MRKFFISLLVSFTMLCSLNAQELICNVTVNSDKISGTNKQIFQSLEKSIKEYMNGQSWTDFVFDSNERIDCSFFITVKKHDSDTDFQCDIQVQARRSVFNSSYYTPLLNFKDENFDFTYAENEPLLFTENTFGTNLTAVLAYYAYVIIGLDADSYSNLGGNPFFEKAEKITNLAQSTSETGWKAFESSKNRYALINNLIDESLRPYRTFFYQYHRFALDEMHVSIEKSRVLIDEGMPTLLSAYKARPSAILLQVFTETKADELVDIFSGGTAKEKKDVYETLMSITPSLTNRLERIKQ